MASSPMITQPWLGAGESDFALDNNLSRCGGVVQAYCTIPDAGPAVGKRVLTPSRRLRSVGCGSRPRKHHEGQLATLATFIVNLTEPICLSAWLCPLQEGHINRRRYGVVQSRLDADHYGLSA